MSRLAPLMPLLLLSSLCIGQERADLFMDQIATDTVRISIERIGCTYFVGCNWSTFVLWQKNDSTHLYGYIEPKCKDGNSYYRIISRKELQDIAELEKDCRVQSCGGTEYDRYRWIQAGDTVITHSSTAYRERLLEIARRSHSRGDRPARLKKGTNKN